MGAQSLVVLLCSTREMDDQDGSLAWLANTQHIPASSQPISAESAQKFQDDSTQVVANQYNRLKNETINLLSENATLLDTNEARIKKKKSQNEEEQKQREANPQVTVDLSGVVPPKSERTICCFPAHIVAYISLATNVVLFLVMAIILYFAFRKWDQTSF